MEVWVREWWSWWGYDGIELVDVACVTSGFVHANRLGAAPAYEVLLATTTGGTSRTDNGIDISVHRRLDTITSRSTPW